MSFIATIETIDRTLDYTKISEEVSMTALWVCMLLIFVSYILVVVLGILKYARLSMFFQFVFTFSILAMIAFVPFSGQVNYYRPLNNTEYNKMLQYAKNINIPGVRFTETKLTKYLEHEFVYNVDDVGEMYTYPIKDTFYCGERNDKILKAQIYQSVVDSLKYLEESSISTERVSWLKKNLPNIITTTQKIRQPIESNTVSYWNMDCGGFGHNKVKEFQRGYKKYDRPSWLYK